MARQTDFQDFSLLLTSKRARLLEQFLNLIIQETLLTAVSENFGFPPFYCNAL